ncbi:MAG: hypothetical protein BA873_00610 [Desulfobulbaceae bacterium C00003063]|nr:MAG: hypothetical protein BA865_05715 [Desulfobacterales bacterium S5133MH4]OEU81760.1 MAG: hypothetical protein BA873_00610 [Desulfobulbaceae bacterium C00003063]
MWRICIVLALTMTILGVSTTGTCDQKSLKGKCIWNHDYLERPGICEQEDLEGTWSIRLGTTDAFGHHCWEECEVRIKSGRIVRGTYVDHMGGRSRITGGRLTISSGCEINGVIRVSNETLYVETGTCDRDGGLVVRVAKDTLSGTPFFNHPRKSQRR